MELIFKLKNIQEAAQNILKSNPNKVILVNGKMGAGKTTFIKQLAKELGVTSTTSSPTFSIVNEYQGKDSIVYHFDVYRLKNETEALDMGIEEYLYSGNWCFIEWAKKIKTLIPKQHSVIDIEELSNGSRKLILNHYQ